jgi:pimeloyl-ACP methyl ester carboxylesterase
VNRRRFLAVSGTAGLAGLAGLSGNGCDSGRFGSGAPSPSSAPGLAEINGQLDSRYMQARMGWTISTPAGGHRPRAIVYCLHAKGANHRMAFDSIRVPQAAASIGFDVAVAAVDGGPDSYWHKRADGTDALAMFLHEFVPLVRDRVGQLPQALMGWSMGGYGALLAAERSRRQFAAVSPASPALWLTPGATAPGAFDSPADFYANDVFTGVGNLAQLAVAVWCGTGDPFYLATRHLVSLMRFPHQAHFGPGSHDPGYWRKAAMPQLRAIAAAPEIAR